MTPYVYYYPNPIIATGSPITWPSTFEAINLAVIPNSNNIIVWDRNPLSQTTPGQGMEWQQRFSVGDPENPATFVNYVLRIPPNQSVYLGDLFCSGHVWLPDGRLFVVGGNTRYPSTGANYFEGSQFAGIWDPTQVSTTGTLYGWTWLPNMSLKRWYPTVTLTGDNKVMVSGGMESTANSYQSDLAFNSYEVWDLALGGLGSNGQWESTTPGGPSTVYAGPTLVTPQNPGAPFWDTLLGEYPRMHLMSNNKVFLSGMCQGANRVDFHLGATLPRAWATSPPNWPAYSTQLWRDYGSSVLLPNVGNTLGGRDLVMIMGGGRYASLSVWSSAEVADGGAAVSTWTSFGNMLHPRMCANAVLLCNGDTLMIGGSDVYHFGADAPHPVYAAETFDKVNGWDEEAPQASPRMYHSTAGYLPSGKVVSAGSDTRSSDYEVFTPDHLKPGSVRPVFGGAWANPGFTNVSFGGEYLIEHEQLPVGVSISRVVLMRPCSVTHHSDMDQRYVELHFVEDGSELPDNTVSVRMPPAPNQAGTTRGSVVAPPGFYMMFLISSEGTPSVAEWVRLQ